MAVEQRRLWTLGVATAAASSGASASTNVDTFSDLQHKRQRATAIKEARGLGLHPRILCSVFGHCVEVDEVRLQHVAIAEVETGLWTEALN